MSRFREIFKVSKPVIGMIALSPLLGYPEFPGFGVAIDRALQDLETLEKGGVDAVCIENDYDHPHKLIPGPEVIASFTSIAAEVAKAAHIPVGLQVLLNDWRASLSIARVIKAKFVRLDFFVDKVRIQAGVIDPEPQTVLDFRKQLGAESVALFTDVQVKYSEVLEPGKTVAASVKQAIAYHSDAVIVSGKITGEAPALADVQEAREAAGDFPILIGSGLKAENVEALFPCVDGAIVGTSLKDHNGPDARIILQRVQRLMDSVKPLRK